jgi:hypothetical protein
LIRRKKGKKVNKEHQQMAVPAEPQVKMVMSLIDSLHQRPGPGRRAFRRVLYGGPSPAGEVGRSRRSRRPLVRDLEDDARCNLEARPGRAPKIGSCGRRGEASACFAAGVRAAIGLCRSRRGGGEVVLD